jgi:poly(hydroxyalkanoate) granule-associated protein
MAKTKADIEELAEQVEQEAKEKVSPLLDAVRRVLLASIGAVALAADEIEDFVNKLVERGEIAEKDGRKLVKDVLERRKEMEMRPIVQKLDRQMDRFLTRLNIPTRDDVESLNARIADLSKKIDELKES